MGMYASDLNQLQDSLTTTKVEYDRPDGYGSYDSIELCDDVIKVR